MIETTRWCHPRHDVDLQPTAINYHAALHRHPGHSGRAVVGTHRHESGRMPFHKTVLRQPDHLRGMGVDFVQGSALGSPAPMESYFQKERKAAIHLHPAIASAPVEKL